MKKLVVIVAFVGFVLGALTKSQALPRQPDTGVFSCQLCRSVCSHGPNPGGCVQFCQPPNCSN